MTRYQNLVNGEWKSSEKEITIYSPINQEELGTVPAMSQAEVDEAMKAARAALPAWRALSAVDVRLICIRQQLFWNAIRKKLVLSLPKK